jgi:hypothetical protein
MLAAAPARSVPAFSSKPTESSWKMDWDFRQILSLARIRELGGERVGGLEPWSPGGALLATPGEPQANPLKRLPSGRPNEKSSRNCAILNVSSAIGERSRASLKEA